MTETSTSRGRAAAGRDVVSRLRRVEGQVRGLERMVEEDRACIDVLTQIAAASRALQGVALALLEDHIRHCLVDGDTEQQDVLVREACDAVARLVRS